MWKVLIVLVVLSVIGASNGFSSRKLRWVVDDTGCRTPNRGVGNCIPLSQCRTLQSLRSNLPELRKYYCSFASSVVSVCCPNEEPSGNRRSVSDNIKLLPSDCGASNTIHKITNGEKSDLFEFPWQVALKYDDRVNQFQCAGSLINDRYVLTAAHCTRGLKLIGVRLGEHDLQTNPDCQTDRNKTICAPQHIDMDITASDVTVHENYIPKNFRNDVALIRLPRRVEFTRSVAPICLPIKENLIKKVGNLTVIGWGLTQHNKLSSVLLKVTVPTVDMNSCRQIFSRTIDISDNQFCAGGKDGKDSCRGDSGGPIMHSAVDDGEIRWVQTGIVSFGHKFCGTERIPAMYTKTTAYTEWIVRNLRP